MDSSPLFKELGNEIKLGRMKEWTSVSIIIVALVVVPPKHDDV